MEHIKTWAHGYMGTIIGTLFNTITIYNSIFQFKVRVRVSTAKLKISLSVSRTTMFNVRFV